MAGQTKNAIMSGVTTFSLFGMALPKLFRAFGWLDTAAAVADWFWMVRHPMVNWPAIFTFTFFIGLSVLLYDNWNVVRRTARWMRGPSRQKWDAPSYQAIDWIENHSLLSFGKTGESATRGALAALEEAARDGRVVIGGRKIGEANHKPIPRCVWRHAKLEGNLSDRVVSRKYPEKVLYEDVVVEMSAVMLEWRHPANLEGRI